MQVSFFFIFKALFGISNKEVHMSGKFRVHRFDINMVKDQEKLEQFLNNLKGEVVAIVPNVTISFFWAHRVDFLLIIEKVE